MSRGWVVDASAIVELLLRTPAGERVGELLAGRVLVAPAHLDAEVFSALARLARADPGERPHVPARLHRLARAPVTRHSCRPLLTGAWALADNVAARDALYVELARRLDLPLLTCDARLAGVPAGVLGIDVRVP
ncbi:type II toxin-antitoxin system VapC family toxin [Pseudonocardia sp. H11422]|uniref:type II toxin-antitoxin system VapC family toxin n=1 Tax=Pseudonocardia sp. H11422 TaxID=2835866 RepID=UPI001BDC4D12|nr:type II toxin-antitoxin system VapC family toxin [Pseudonocardia sp. H11422]